MQEIRRKIDRIFREHFGRTPLKERLSDIQGECNELMRFTDIENLKEELGDLLCSCIQLANESQMPVEDLIEATLLKIKRRHLQYKGLGRKIKVAIYGGSFNPPHEGHLEVARTVLKASKCIDEVWLMPCYQSLYGKGLEAPEMRLQMCESLCENEPMIKVWNYEIENEFMGSTFHFIRMLEEEDFSKNTYDFHFLIGADTAVNIKEWPAAEGLIKMAKLIVVSRKGINIPLEDAWFLTDPAHMYLKAELEREISSTKIKEMIKDHSCVDELLTMVPIEVLEIIRKNNLYGG